MTTEFAIESLPHLESVTQLLDTMYQASLLREEGKPVQCRIIVSPESEFVNE